MMKLVFDAGRPPVTLEPGVKRIGTAPDADVVLEGEGLLPQHCELHVTAQGTMLKIARDAAVAVNERPVDGLISLRAGDRIAFGPVEAALLAPDGESERAPASAPPLDDVGATVVRAALPKYALRAQTGRMLGKAYPIAGATVIGRAPDCQIRMEESSLSRKHAKLIPTSEGVLVEDLGSTNGSYLNGKRIQRAMAQPGDEVGFDTLRFRLLELGQDGAQPAEAAAARGATPRWIWLAAVVAVVAIALAVLR